MKPFEYRAGNAWWDVFCYHRAAMPMVLMLTLSFPACTLRLYLSADWCLQPSITRSRTGTQHDEIEIDLWLLMLSIWRTDKEITDET